MNIIIIGVFGSGTDPISLLIVVVFFWLSDALDKGLILRLFKSDN